MNNQTAPWTDPRFQNPPPPPAFVPDGAEVYLKPAEPLRCNMCSDRREITVRSLKKDYIPFAGYLALILGVLPGLLLILVLKTQHRFSLPFCDNCWRRSRNADRLEALSVAVFFLSIIAGVVLLLSFDSGLAFFVPIVFGAGLVVWGQIHKRKNSPRFKKIDRKQVIVSTASGELISSEFRV